MGEPRSTGNRPQSEALKDHRSHAFDKPQRQGLQQTTEDTESTEVCLCNSSVSSVSSVVCSKPFSVPSVGLFKPFSVRLHPLTDAQVLTYLKLSSLKTALVLNFNVALLRDGVRRLV